MDADLPARWQADWVWCGDSGVRVGHLEGERDPAVVDRFVMLRRGFDLEALARGARGFIRDRTRRARGALPQEDSARGQRPSRGCRRGGAALRVPGTVR